LYSNVTPPPQRDPNENKKKNETIIKAKPSVVEWYICYNLYEDLQV
jgi:hypothetical protein